MAGTVKWFEVRDRGTMMACMAVKTDCAPAESGCVKHAGFKLDSPRVIVYWPLDHEASYDPYRFVKHAFGCTVRTEFEATKFIQEHFDDLVAGQVIDVEYILGESDAPKASDMEPVRRGI